MQFNTKFSCEWTLHYYLKYFLNKCCILTASLNVHNIYVLCKSIDDIFYFDQANAKYIYNSNYLGFAIVSFQSVIQPLYWKIYKIKTGSVW